MSHLLADAVAVQRIGAHLLIADYVTEGCP